MILYSGRSSRPSARFETERFPIPRGMRVSTRGLRSPKLKHDEWKSQPSNPLALPGTVTTLSAYETG